MQLVFIPRKWRLAPWQVWLGAALTFAWWGFLTYILLVESLPNFTDILFAASWPLPAWLVYWLFVNAIKGTTRWVSANHPGAARALTEVAAFAAMIGGAMLVTYLFPERHFWHGEASRDAAYSPVVFAPVLICEVAMYIAWKILNVKQVVGKTVSPSPTSARVDGGGGFRPVSPSPVCVRATCRIRGCE
jgi:hypothetical protein